MCELNQYVAGIRRFGRITREREVELSGIIQRVRKPEKIRAAVDELVNANLMLVVSRAIKMTRKFFFLNIDVMDFVSEGNVALVKAAETYKTGHESNAAFGTYAVKVIDYKMLGVLKSDAFIHVPSNFFAYKKRFDQLKEERGGDVTDSEVMKELDVSQHTLGVLKRGNSHKVVHLEDMRVDEEGESNWQELVEDENSVRPSEEMSRGDSLSFMMRYVNKLSQRERTIIMEKDLNERRLTYDELTHVVGITRERIRQVHEKALRKLKVMMMTDWQARFGKIEMEKEPSRPDYGFNYGMHDPKDVQRYWEECQMVKKKNARTAFRKLSSW